jgi:hypothetical protein
LKALEEHGFRTVSSGKQYIYGYKELQRDELAALAPDRSTVVSTVLSTWIDCCWTKISTLTFLVDRRQIKRIFEEETKKWNNTLLKSIMDG